ncbi:MAG: GNAT family N-acetyltransferase [Proteobacteria bacterium]|nr:GNAT family N-acetyltransferase [Pseudomonadota bacterium]
MNTTSSDQSMSIRRATRDDASAISALILSLAHHFLLHADGSGADAFLLALGPAGIERNIAATELDYYVGMVGSQMAGVVAVRHTTHLFHLFVGHAFQRRGVARALWSHVKAVYEWPSASAPTTVNSTPFALSFYERIGFQATGPRVETNGIAFIPMQLAQA